MNGGVNIFGGTIGISGDVSGRDKRQKTNGNIMSNSQSGVYSLNYFVKMTTGDEFFCHDLTWNDESSIGERLLVGAILVSRVNDENEKPETVHADDCVAWWKRISPRMPAYWESVMKGAEEL